MVETVLFWDIDGTLLSTGRAGIFAWEDAVRGVLGVPCDLQDFHTAGVTDAQIGRRLVEVYGGCADDERAAAIVRLYEAALPERLPLRQGRVLPGVRRVLEYVRGRPEVLSLLLTGNTRAGARAKLRHYGLAEFFVDGAFADDARDRPSVARRARALAEAMLGESCPPPERMYVIGDTPEDIACGRAIGARTVAVATGAYSPSELRQHRPWRVLDQLPEPAAFLRLLNDEGDTL